MHKTKLIKPFTERAVNQTRVSCLLHTEKISEAVLPYVFMMAFPASLLSKSKKEHVCKPWTQKHKKKHIIGCVCMHFFYEF